MIKLNGSAKWMIVILMISGILFSAGYAIKINNQSIQDLKDIKIEKRLTKLETSFIAELKHINNNIKEIKEKLSK